MIKRNLFLLATSVALISLTTMTAVADEWNKETVLQFSAPVEVPGKVLQPGKYVFRLADDESDRHVVQIFSEDEEGNQDFVTTILAVPDYRLETPDRTIIEFEERSAGAPEAIKSWFYPGDNAGWHFTYPKSERLEASKAVTSPAPAEAPTFADAAVADAADAPPIEAPGEPEPVTLEEEPAVVAQLEPAPAAAPVDADPPAADPVLPETAGDSFILLFAGITIMGAGLVAVSMSLRRA
jgi:hypothetical protein